MQRPMQPGVAEVARDALYAGGLAAFVSACAMTWRGQRDCGSAVATLNAPSQWIHGRAAVHELALDARHTVTGTAIHCASSLLWSAVYAWVGAQRRRPTPATAVIDAVAVTALAATVDLKLVPERLTPGFQHRMNRGSLALVYASFAAGLALAGLRRQALRRSREERGGAQEDEPREAAADGAR